MAEERPSMGKGAGKNGVGQKVVIQKSIDIVQEILLGHPSIDAKRGGSSTISNNRLCGLAKEKTEIHKGSGRRFRIYNRGGASRSRKGNGDSGGGDVINDGNIDGGGGVMVVGGVEVVMVMVSMSMGEDMEVETSTSIICGELVVEARSSLVVVVVARSQSRLEVVVVGALPESCGKGLK